MVYPARAVFENLDAMIFTSDASPELLVYTPDWRLIYVALAVAFVV